MDSDGGMDHSPKTTTKASSLVRQLIDEHDPKYGVGSMTCSLYDTAWVAMISKTIDGQTRWLFPASFKYLLDTQKHDGGWHTSSICVDAILNTLAALLAVCKHIATPLQATYISKEDLEHRKTRAIYYLEAKFAEWEVPVVSHHGFELLIPKILHLLAQEGVDFYLPNMDLLMDLRARTSAKFSPGIIYNQTRSPAAQYLEGLIGEINFDKVGHHKISGSIMASPASTAAYLIHSSSWDEEAEKYLDHVISVTDEKSGGVPSRYPTSVFEVTSALSVLLENGFNADKVGQDRLEDVARFLEQCLRSDAGVTGFAPYVESDGDNTARAISTLCLLGKLTTPHGLIVRCESQEFFKTYTQDRTPRFSTNCLVLKALLDLLPKKGEQMPQIEKAIKFITHYWWTTNGHILDQSNVSITYPLMLMINSFTSLVNLWEQGFLPPLDDFVLKDRVFICLFQALSRLLQIQNSDGSWGHDQRCETTAYAILSLTKLSSFSSAPRVKSRLIQAVETGRQFLSLNFHPKCEPDHIWTGKTTSGSDSTLKAYVLAALHAPLSAPLAGQSLEQRFEIPLAKLVIQTKHYNRQASFASVPLWQIQACLVESYLLLPQLRDLQFSVFPNATLNDDQYFESIPFTWVAANTINARFVGTEYLHQMMISSMLNRQLEDYFRNVIGEDFSECLFEMEELLHGLFQDFDVRVCEDEHVWNNGPFPGCSAPTGAVQSLEEVRKVFRRFVSRILNHPHVLKASQHDRFQVCSELISFLLGQIRQLSSQATRQNPTPGHSPRFNRSTDQTDHAYDFAFLACLTGNSLSPHGAGLKKDFLDTSEQQYLAADLCRHLSIISFMSNTVLIDDPLQDHQQQHQCHSRSISFGSGRDVSDGSISLASSTSSYYPDDDVSPVSAVSSTSSAPSTTASAGFFKPPQRALRSEIEAPSQSLQLSRLLNHERRSLNICLDSLAETGINQPTADIIGLFVDFSELSERIYGDPNIGNYQSTTACDTIEQICTLNLSPKPLNSPKYSLRGSASITHTPTFQPPSIQHSLREGLFVATDTHYTRGQADSDKSERQQHHKSQRVAPSIHSRASCTEDEVSQIERIMREMDSWPIPTPKTNPILNASHRHSRSEGSLKWLKLQNNALPSPTPSETGSLKLAHTRTQSQIRDSDETQPRAANAVQAKVVEETEESRRNAILCQTKATEQAQKSHESGGRDQSATVGHETRGYAAGGWVKAPPAEMMAVNALPIFEGEKQGGRFRRLSRSSGPLWKAPF